MKIVRAYKFRLAPSYAQRAQLWAACEMARRAWNWTVRLCEAEYEQALADAGVLDPRNLAACQKRKQRIAVMAKARALAKERSITIKRPSINRGRLYKTWCEMRDSTTNSIRTYHSHVYSYPIDRVVKAYKDWWSKKGGRAGAPRYHGDRYPSSFTVQIVRRAWDEMRIKIPGIGEIDTLRECPLKRIPPGKPCTITVSRRANDWYASIAMKDVDYSADCGAGCIGVDMGMGAIVTTSAGEKIPPPNALAPKLRLLARRQRQQQRRTKGSRRYVRGNIKVAEVHDKVARIRADHLHKLTTILARRYETIVIEGFDIVGLVSESVEWRAVRRGMLDLGWGEMRRQLDYKLAWRGGVLVVAPKQHPTNRECHVCGTLNECPPTQTTYRCSECRLKISRQLNTAKLLEKFPSGSTPGHGETNGRGGSERAA